MTDVRLSNQNYETKKGASESISENINAGFVPGEGDSACDINRSNRISNYMKR